MSGDQADDGDRQARLSERKDTVHRIIGTARGKDARFRDERITMAHGAGGKATATLIEGLLAPTFASPALKELADAGVIELGGARLAMTCDAFVVKPLRFPGGSIGELAVNGTVNDLAMAGARPGGMTLSLIMEEGLASDVLREEVEAVARAARTAGIEILGGDTKVVERGACDQLYMTTTGIGTVDDRARLSPSALVPGDVLIISGRIGEHGTAIMVARGEFELGADVRSDTRCLWPAVDALLGAAGPHLRCLRDATRGGVASVLNELAQASGVSMLVREADVPVLPVVAGAAELLGIDPLYVANEGAFVAAVAAAGADAAVAALRGVEGCEEARVFGQVEDGPEGLVLVETGFGGRRVMDQLVGDPLPRIC